jgi:F-type H+-transporting ATPase subunit gamma
MASILDIRRRIRSVINTRQITKAMKTVSAAKLRRAQEAAMAARPYAQMLTNVLKSLVSRTDLYDEATGLPLHPLLAEREEKNILLIVVTGDKGLAGAFNTNILKLASKFIQHRSEQNIDLECIGRKGRDFMRRRYPVSLRKRQEQEEENRNVTASDKENTTRAGRVQIVGEHIGVLGKVGYDFANELAQSVIELYERNEIDGVYLLFNEFKSVIAQRLVAERILPIKEIGEVDVEMAEEPSAEERKQRLEAAKSEGVGVRRADTEAEEEAKKFGTASTDYIYEQPPGELFAGILPKYIGIQIFHALLESVAAEHAARMTAMDSATNNASDMIDSLTLAMNRARQAKITKEIIEIVSGAAAAQ